MISVGMGEIKLSSDPGEVLCALGLGSCIGIAMFDAISGIAGMGHIVLASGSVAGDKLSEPGRYADTGVPLLAKEMESAGATRESIGVAIAGGAELFKRLGQGGSILRIGRRNALAVEEALASLGLVIRGKDVGGKCGRSLSLRVADGIVMVRALGHAETVLAELASQAGRAGAAQDAA